AVKFTEHGRITVEARLLHETEHRTEFRIAVRDTGLGIPAEAQAGLFEPFVQLAPASAQTEGGTGLGLAISRQLVELMGGRIGFESEAERGSTFWFELELARAGDSKSPFEAIPAGCRVFVVDDNVDDR